MSFDFAVLAKMGSQEHLTIFLNVLPCNNKGFMILWDLLCPPVAFIGLRRPSREPSWDLSYLCQGQVHVNVLKINIVIFYNSHGKRGLENVYFVFCQACIYPIMLADDRGQSQFITQMWRNQAGEKVRTGQKKLDRNRSQSQWAIHNSMILSCNQDHHTFFCKYRLSRLFNHKRSIIHMIYGFMMVLKIILIVFANLRNCLFVKFDYARGVRKTERLIQICVTVCLFVCCQVWLCVRRAQNRPINTGGRNSATGKVASRAVHSISTRRNDFKLFNLSRQQIWARIGLEISSRNRPQMLL